MESFAPIYAKPGDENFKKLYDEYERVFGDRPPVGDHPEDYRAALDAVNLTRTLFKSNAQRAPVTRWPSQVA